jgi:hypothetical protein
VQACYLELFIVFEKFMDKKESLGAKNVEPFDSLIVVLPRQTNSVHACMLLFLPLSR